MLPDRFGVRYASVNCVASVQIPAYLQVVITDPSMHFALNSVDLPKAAMPPEAKGR